MAQTRTMGLFDALDLARHPTAGDQIIGRILDRVRTIGVIR